jgi:TRAP-type C4-dicarboxylate transport system permease small subunit
MSRLRASCLANFEEIVAGAALIIVVLAVCWGVITRYITAQPATWAGEVAAIAFAWSIFIGSSAALKRGMHVSIDMLVIVLPPPARRVVTIVGDVIVLIFLAIGLGLAIEFTAEAWDNPSSVLRIPMSTIYLSVVVGFASLLLRYAQMALARLRTPESA